MAATFQDIINAQRAQASVRSRDEAIAEVRAVREFNQYRNAVSGRIRSNATSVKGIGAVGARKATHSPVTVTRFVDGVAVSVKVVGV